MIQFPIVKPYLPAITKYQAYVTDIYQRNWLTNNGPLLQALESRLAEYLGVEHLLLVSNGTLALQVAYAALDVSGQVLTTPFSFAATASSLVWQHLQPHFIDIDEQTLNIAVDKITAAQASASSALLAVHVFGNPCNVDKINALATQHDLKVIYDAAHAFGSPVADRSVLSWGDASTLSLHATKLFHSVEGGAIIFKDKAVYEKARQLINFGFDNQQYPQFIGINAKMSEFHAAMGLAVLDDIEMILQHRHALIGYYQQWLADAVEFQVWHPEGKINGAYMPVLLKDEPQLLKVANCLLEQGIQTRRYFYPSLSQVPVYGMQGVTPIANNISQRILCLPMYFDLSLADVKIICDALKRAL